MNSALLIILYLLTPACIVSQLEPDPSPIPQPTNRKVFSDGYTLLDAAKAGALQAVKEFIEHEADVTQIDERGFTPLMLTCERGHYISAMDLLKANSDIHYKSPGGQSALSLAVNGNFKEIVQQLLSLGADPNTVNRSGISMLSLATQLNFINIVKLLLANGANVHQRSPLGDFPLLMASTGGYVPIVTVLLEFGADVEAVNDLGYTSLMMAASRGHVSVVNLFITHGGVDLNRKDHLKRTALDHAIYAQRKEVIQLLVLQGVDIGPKGLPMDEETLTLWREARTRRLEPDLRIITNEEL